MTDVPNRILAKMAEIMPLTHATICKQPSPTVRVAMYEATMRFLETNSPEKADAIRCVDMIDLGGI